LQAGNIQAYVDFFYITTDTTPSEIEPSKRLQEDYKLNKKKKEKFKHTEDELKNLSSTLRDAEDYQRKNNTEQCLKKYKEVALKF
jgi:hypothetical protein